MDPTDAEPALSRKFSLGDSMLLMASLALTFVDLKASYWFVRLPVRAALWWRMFQSLTHQRPWDFPGWPRSLVISQLAIDLLSTFLIELLSSVLLGLTLIQPLVRLRKPRPPLRAVVRQSGTAVCLGLILASLMMTDLQWLAGIYLTVRPAFPAASIGLLLWPLLGIRPWRLEASWIDRLGRAVGWGWIVVMAATGAVNWLSEIM